ncbi:hypothetical protein EJ110_NYTH11438 [Nymphaea thermarum]|nr:hypothetical protein EJ110_NYTH11438 [Nymphaea thermarum]
MGKKRRWELLNIAILIREQGGKIKHKLHLFKKVRKFRRHSFLQHYNYNFMAEYEFSPDSSPDFPRKRARGCLYPLLLCGATCRGGTEDDDESALVSEDLAIVVEEKVAEGAPESDDEREVSTDGTDSVDRKAEEFIARFYREIRLERQVSELQFSEMLNRGCS